MKPDDDQIAVHLSECLKSIPEEDLFHYTPISEGLIPLSPVAAFTFDTDDSDETELNVPRTPNTRNVTKISNIRTFIPIILSDISEDDTPIHSNDPVASTSLVLLPK